MAESNDIWLRNSHLVALVAGGLLAAKYLYDRNRRSGSTARTFVEPHPRDFCGYGQHPPEPKWPNGARLAINFVINVEEASEPSFSDGDGYTEAGLIECPSDFRRGERDLCSESMFEYGSRVGIWRVLREFQKRNFTATVTGCALALERLPEVTEAIKESGFDICCHGYRWENHFELSKEEEREQIRKAISSIELMMGERPLGWYCRTSPSLHTRKLLIEHGGFLYDSDSYNDELPYWVTVDDQNHLVIPYSLATNDSKYGPGRAFSTSDDYFTFMKDTFDVLYEEGGKMMNVGLHLRLIGHPARIRGLQRFMDYVASHEDVWVCRRIDIARHWIANHPPATPA
jgi:peptidoglycan/xylan/chitin deacetylase (PgdA/CDA1 family)